MYPGTKGSTHSPIFHQYLKETRFRD
jgi:hypothetical protein